LRIGFFGNTNNYPFMVARALRRMGHDVLFIVDRTEPLTRPENRYDDVGVPYPDWIVDLSPLDIHVPLASVPPARARAVSLLRSCDAVFLNMLGPSLWPEVRRPSVVMLTGADLEDYANYGFVLRYLLTQWKGARWRPLGHARENLNNIRDQARYLWRLVGAQRAGIRAASAVSYFARGMVAGGDATLDGIGVPDDRRIFLIMTDPERIAPCPPPRNPVVRLFNVARLTWRKNPGEIPTGGASAALDFKGTDVMVRGISMFVRKTGARLDIRLVRKGRDVEATERLVADEGLGPMVTWADEMTQAGVLEEYASADIVFDQLGQGMISMGCLDAMASGRPVIANGRPEIVARLVGIPSPVCQAQTPGEVCAQLERLVPDPAERARVGIESRRYVEAHFSADRAASLCLERLGAIGQAG
jgi:glycosyltransferase involved in cell wall biosynthesis